MFLHLAGSEWLGNGLLELVRRLSGPDSKRSVRAAGLGSNDDEQRWYDKRDKRSRDHWRYSIDPSSSASAELRPTAFNRRRRSSCLVIAMRISARSLGQTVAPNPNACQYSLPGVTPIPGLAICDPTTGLPQGATSVQPMACSGIEPGAPGYEECMANAEASQESSGYNPFVEGQNLLTVAPLTSSQVALQAAQKAGTPLTAGQVSVLQPSTMSLAPTGGASGGTTGGTAAGGTTGGGTTTAAATTSVTAATTTGCFQLFGSSEPCCGPIGQYTALVGIAAIVAVFFMLRK